MYAPVGEMSLAELEKINAENDRIIALAEKAKVEHGQPGVEHGQPAHDSGVGDGGVGWGRERVDACGCGRHAGGHT